MTTSRVSRVRVACAAATVFLLTPPFTPTIAVAQAGAGPTCFGKAATIVGSKGASRVVGTAGPDVIVSRWDAELHGLAGDDLLCGLSKMYGGRGDDRMSERGRRGVGAVSGDPVFGGPGNDTIFRDEPYDGFGDIHFLTSGGPGRDRLFGGPNHETLSGGPGADRIFGGGRHDFLNGGGGPDFLVSGGGEDILNGEVGSDQLRGEDGNDHLRGGPGNDRERGGAGDDRIRGEDGADVAFGGPDVDSCEAEIAHCELPLRPL